jgi:Protein of unknown function, DUF547
MEHQWLRATPPDLHIFLTHRMHPSTITPHSAHAPDALLVSPARRLRARGARARSSATKRMEFRRCWWALALLALLPPGGWAAEFDRTHAAFARVLSANVANATVDYAHLKESPADLDRYLEQIAAVPPAEFVTWERADRLALLLNLYNAETLRLIRNEYPVKSIRSIGTLPGAAWRRPVVRFAGQILSLSHLENEIIRKEYEEPRIHFALVCAARGCPPLRSEPFVGARLTEQLSDQARQFLAMAEKNRFEPSTGVLWLSPIFKWYEKDFTGPAGSLKAYVQPYFAADVGTVLGRATGVKVRFTEYDWELNDQPR